MCIKEIFLIDIDLYMYIFEGFILLILLWLGKVLYDEWFVKKDYINENIEWKLRWYCYILDYM